MSAGRRVARALTGFLLLVGLGAASGRAAAQAPAKAKAQPPELPALLDLSPVLFVVGEAGKASEPVWLPQRGGPYRVPSGPPRELSLLAPDSKAAREGRDYARLGVQARAPGHFVVELGRSLLTSDAIEIRVLDHRDQPLDVETSHASLSRVLPEGLAGERGPDRDALSFLFIGPVSSSLDTFELVSRRANGAALDVIGRLATQPSECPKATAPELVCRKTRPIRLVADALDRAHESARARSLRAELGGSVRLSLAGKKALELLVGGPRETRFGPIERLRARLRVLVLRARRGGEPAIGDSDASARALARAELTSAAALWSQCGIDFGPPEQLAIDVVDPPPVRLLALGCGFGARASGGELRLTAGGRALRLKTRPGETPTGVAVRLEAELSRLKIASSLFENQRATNEAVATADLVLKGPQALGQDGTAPLSSDPTLPACLGRVDLDDGLTHFGDGDAFAGTVEERALLRAFDDGDPGTIEVLIVPAFHRSSRIGESFMLSSGSSLSNAVIIDRAAIRAGARSYALAHELGHVLLAMPGHPDDFGVDQPSSLMDADVADATLFGPRRLAIRECERALIESGPNGFSPLLTPEPLRPRSAP